MNDKQLEQARRDIRAMGYGWVDGKWIEPPKEVELKLEELDCIDMINSILTYSCSGYKDGEAVLKYEENSWHNYLADHVKNLGREKVIALIQGQIDSMAGIVHDVFTDDEGVTYNSIVWKEN